MIKKSITKEVAILMPKNIRTSGERIIKIKSWKSYFMKKYGENPKCEICNKQLQWYRKNGSHNTVYLDHSSEATFIKKTPSEWYRSHPCTKENIAKLEKTIRGILCCKCNHYLPTKNRIHWLNCVTEYILK